jgi:integrase
VFSGAFGRPLDPEAVTRKLGRILRAAGLPAERPVHLLRHSCASLLIEQGVPPLEVQELLGHEDVATTLRIYAHLFRQAGQRVADQMDEILGAGGEGS